MSRYNWEVKQAGAYGASFASGNNYATSRSDMETQITRKTGGHFNRSGQLVVQGKVVDLDIKEQK